MRNKSTFYTFFFVLIFILYKQSFSNDLFKLTIPNENYRSEEQKINEVLNFKNSGLTEKEWRQKKCYRNVVFNIFWNSNLCPNDPHMCHHSYTVEELHMYKKYWDYLLQISDLCADGYVIENSDAKYFKKSTQGEVDRFVEYIKKNRKKKINYDIPLEDQFDKSKKIHKYKKENLKNNGAHGAVPRPANSKNFIEDIEKGESQIKKREESLIKLEKKLQLEKQLLEEEKTLYDQKKRLEELESKILESEKALREKRDNIE